MLIFSSTHQDLTVMLSEMKRFRPQTTIFEISKSKKAEGLEVMKQKRQTHDVFLAKKRRKMDDAMEEEEAANDPESMEAASTSASETATDAAIDAAFGSNVIAPKNRSDAYFNKLNAEMAKKSKRDNKKSASDYKDGDFYVPDRAADYHTEKGLQVAANSFENEARGATMDLTMDDNEAMRMQQQRNDASKKRWDRKKMKFVGQNEKQVKEKKKIKNEAGQWITASYKTDRYKKWKKMSKVDTAGNDDGGVDDDDGVGGGNDFAGGVVRGPQNVNPAMGFRKRWHTNNAQEKKIIRDGVLSKEKILKTRMKKEAKKSYQLYRQKMNKKKR